jgi:hypothetical protein
MQFPPLIFSDLSFLLAVDAIILLLIILLASPSSPLKNLTLNKKKLRTAAIALGILFLLTVTIRAIEIIA